MKYTNAGRQQSARNLKRAPTELVVIGFDKSGRASGEVRAEINGASFSRALASYFNNNTITTPQIVRSVLATAKQIVNPNAGTRLWAAS
jgi:hypothetical protein